MQDLPQYQYAGARALVALHDRHLRDCMGTWERALRADVPMPVTEDPEYASIESVGVHVLACARKYMVWCCEKLELPDPGIESAPSPESVATAARGYLDHVLDRWRTPLAEPSSQAFTAKDYPAPWGPLYSIDSMLEHAVMHPIRHQFQMDNWLTSRG